jgi:hypothetical protein
VRLQRTALIVCLLVIVVMMVMLAGGRGRSTARGIFVDGRLAALVANRSAAQEVSRLLLKREKGKLAGSASFQETWSDETCRTEGQPVLSVKDAVTLLGQRVTVLVQAAAIRVDGKDVLAMDTTQTAEAALEALKQEYVAQVGQGRSVTQVKLVQKVEVANVQVPAQRIQTDVSTGVKVLKSAVPPLTVRVVVEGSRDLTYYAPDTKETGETLAAGTQRVISDGRPGVKRVYERTVYDNGKLVKTDRLRSEVVTEAIGRRVLVGSAPAAANSPSDQTTPGTG